MSENKNVIRLENGKRMYVYIAQGNGAYKLVHGSLKGKVSSEIRTVLASKGDKYTSEQLATISIAKQVERHLKNGYEVVKGDLTALRATVATYGVSVNKAARIQKQLDKKRQALVKIAERYVALKEAIAELEKKLTPDAATATEATAE